MNCRGFLAKTFNFIRNVSDRMSQGMVHSFVEKCFIATINPDVFIHNLLVLIGHDQTVKRK